MSSEVRSSHLKPPPPQELQRILADLYSSRKEDKLHTEGHKSVALVMEQQSGGNSSGPNVGQTNNNRAGDEESGMYDDNDDDDDDDEEEDNDELDHDSIASADDFVRQIASGGMEMATVKMSRPNKKTKAKRKKKKAKRSKKRVTVAGIRSFMAQKEEEKDLQRDNGVAVMTAGDFVT